MDTQNIPKQLHHLIDLVEEWGINDDGYRDEKIESSSTERLVTFVNRLKEQDILSINYWLSDKNEIVKSSDEYINYTCFIMAF